MVYRAFALVVIAAALALLTACGARPTPLVASPTVGSMPPVDTATVAVPGTPSPRATQGTAPVTRPSGTPKPTTGAQALSTQAVRDPRGACEITPPPALVGEPGVWYGQRGLVVRLSSPILDGLAFPDWAARDVARLLQDPSPTGVAIIAREVRPDLVRIDHLSNIDPRDPALTYALREATLLIPGPAGLACALHTLQPRAAATAGDEATVETILSSLRPVVGYTLGTSTMETDPTGRCRIALPARYGQGRPGMWGDGQGGLVTLTTWSAAGATFEAWADANAESLVAGLFGPPPQRGRVERAPGRYRADFVGEAQEFYAGALGVRPKVVFASVPTGADTACVLLVAFDSTRDAEYAPLVDELVASLAGTAP